jgi:putative ABC transport system ATP-binding protein
MTDPFITLNNLSKSYTEGEHCFRILDSVDMTIHAGEFIVLLGRSGSGKSTLLNLIAGIDTPDTGTITIAGKALNRLDERERTLFRRASVGFIFQSFNLIPTLTVEENLRLPLELNGKAGQTERILALLTRLGLSERQQAFPDRLSGGEQQRVAIGRSLIHDPLIVLADEPTGNLDLETGREVLSLLDSVTREAGKTLIMATHSQEVIGLADRIFTVGQGKLTENVPMRV